MSDRKMQVWHLNYYDPTKPADQRLNKDLHQRHMKWQWAEGEAPSFPEEFILVAEVDVVVVEDAYRLTNHIDHDWSLNSSVTAFRKSRSTSVGDVIIDCEGARHRCLNAGWEQF